MAKADGWTSVEVSLKEAIAALRESDDVWKFFHVFKPLAEWRLSAEVERFALSGDLQASQNEISIRLIVNEIWPAGLDQPASGSRQFAYKRDSASGMVYQGAYIGEEPELGENRHWEPIHGTAVVRYMGLAGFWYRFVPGRIRLLVNQQRYFEFREAMTQHLELEVLFVLARFVTDPEPSNTPKVAGDKSSTPVPTKEPEGQSSPAKQPKRSDWLDAQMKSRGLNSPYALQKIGGPARLSIEKVLNGTPVSHKVLAKIASALSRNNWPKVETSEIPPE